MTNSSPANDSSSAPSPQVHGITEIRQKTIAALIARGFSVKYVAKKLKMSPDHIYHLFSDKNSLVNAEINRFLNEAFVAGDRRLINLYDKALQKLDAMLSSSDAETQCRAIDRIIRIYLTRSAKNAVTIQQYFGIQSENEAKSIDDIIKERRKERGLDKMPDRENDPDSFPDDDLPDNSSPNTPSPNVSSPEREAFLEKIR